MPRTLLDKIWDAHVVHRCDGRPDLIYVDLHLVHEVTSPQAFEGLRTSNRRVRRPDLTIATVDHNVPTVGRSLPWEDETAATQVEVLRRNCRDARITLYDVDSTDQGIVHVIGPELGLTQPGMTIVCGDSHTSTHGAFGALAFGIGTSEVEHVLATQCLSQVKPRSFEIQIDGELPAGVTAKDVALGVIDRIGTSGGAGFAIEFTGSSIRSLSMEGRMTLCNMSIEAGARAGLVAPDQTTRDYLEGCPQSAFTQRLSPFALGLRDDGRSSTTVELASDAGATFDRRETIDSRLLAPFVTWGTNPGMVAPVTGAVPTHKSMNPDERPSIDRALAYMGIAPGTRIEDITIDRVFIGSCTNARIEDLRAAAAVVKGYRLHSDVRGMVVPGSQRVRRAAEAEGLDRIFLDAGLEWRDAGCSMCLGMNPDTLASGERCASTSNRNFEGRQGRGGRTHLVSPSMAAAAAVRGRFTDVREWTYR